MPESRAVTVHLAQRLVVRNGRARIAYADSAPVDNRNLTSSEDTAQIGSS